MANANVRRNLSDVGMVEQGANHCEVRLALSVHHTVVTRAWVRYQQYGTPIRRHGGGRTRATSAADDSYLVIQARRKRFSTATQLRSDLQNATGVRVSTKRYAHSCMNKTMYLAPFVSRPLSASVRLGT